MNGEVVVIGGGASGMTAAIAAARNGLHPVILEHTDRLGRKLLSTGNGKCNLTNLVLTRDCYRSQRPEFPMEALSHFTPRDAITFFESLGILTKERDGYVYPNSQQASSVLTALTMELERLKVPVVCGCRIQEITAEPDGMTARTSQGEFHGPFMILSTGSKAAPSTGSDGSGYELAARLGHRVVKPLPALVQLCCRGKEFKRLAGVRTAGMVKLLVDQKEAARDQGELQLTNYGLSGIPVFQVSRFASVALDQNRKVKARIDFLPSMSKDDLAGYLLQRKKRMGHVSGEQFLNGVLNQKLASWLLICAGIAPGEPVGGQKTDRIRKLGGLIKEYDVEVTGVNSFEQAQVCCGGVDVSEVDPHTMRSKLVPGLYLTGELLDVDGICGGYNLQWAWATGYLAGTGCAKRRNHKKKEIQGRAKARGWEQT